MSGYHDDPHPPGYVDAGGSSFGAPADSWHNKFSRPVEHRVIRSASVPVTEPTKGEADMTDERIAILVTVAGMEEEAARQALELIDASTLAKSGPSFTPGPWHTIRTSSNTYRHEIRSGPVGRPESQYIVAAAYGGGSMDAEVEPNANLIAAAPELYAAVVHMVRKGNLRPEDLDVLIPAMNKARGIGVSS